jgi:hypothetical protein
MIEKEKNEMTETETAYALTMILTNFLLLAVLGVCFWFVFFIIRENHSFDAIVHGRFLS